MSFTIAPILIKTSWRNTLVSLRYRTYYLLKSFSRERSRNSWENLLKNFFSFHLRKYSPVSQEMIFNPPVSLRCGVGTSLLLWSALSTAPEGGLVTAAKAWHRGLVGGQVGDPGLDLVVALCECGRGTWGFGLGVSEIPESMCDVIIV